MRNTEPNSRLQNLVRSSPGAPNIKQKSTQAGRKPLPVDMNFYNENEPRAAAWLRELISAKLIPPGIVDERSIADIKPDELTDFTQCHFFAGIGGWSRALELAGWPADRPVWTGSCPCQPFSAAGKGLGTADERHLWPVFAELIRACKPPVVFGEQVASKAGREWLAGVFADLEGMAYQRAGADLCAASVGAPHIRQRLWWVADSNLSKRDRWARSGEQQIYNASAGLVGLADSEPQHDGGGQSGPGRRFESSNSGHSGRLGNSVNARLEGLTGDGHDGDQSGRVGAGTTGPATQAGTASGVGHSRCQRNELGGRADDMGRAPAQEQSQTQKRERGGNADSHSGAHNFWSNAVLVPCRDGKARRVEPDIFPLAHGVPGRVGLLRGAGNAIVPECAAEFIRSYLEVTTSCK